MNCQALKHPRTQLEIEAAMWLAVQASEIDGYGICLALSASGKVIAVVKHDRQAIPAFSFSRNGQNITAQVLAVLRGEK